MFKKLKYSESYLWWYTLQFQQCKSTALENKRFKICISLPYLKNTFLNSLQIFDVVFHCLVYLEHILPSTEYLHIATNTEETKILYSIVFRGGIFRCSVFLRGFCTVFGVCKKIGYIRKCRAIWILKSVLSDCKEEM